MPKEQGRYKDGENAIKELHKRINELEEALKQARVGSPRPSEGGNAEIRIVDTGQGNVFVEIKTKNGWMRTAALTEVPKEK